MDETNPNYVKITGYIERNPAAVISTIGEDGPHGAVVYVITASHGTLCFVTKNKTRKYTDIVNHPSVSLTFFNEKEGTTLQISGQAYAADNNTGLKDIVLDKMKSAHAMVSNWAPPVTKIMDGEFAVIGVDIKTARLVDYGSGDVGGPSYVTLN